MFDAAGTGAVLLDSRTWKVIGVLRAGAALLYLGFSSRRAGTAPGTGFLGVLSMPEAVAKDST